MQIRAFEFATAGRIVFGRGRLQEAGPIARELGTRAMVVSGAHPGRSRRLTSLLEAAGVSVIPQSVSGEPSIRSAAEGAERARGAGVQFVVGMGGGSVLDAAKAIAALATNPGDPLEFVEVIGRAQPLRADPLPVIAIPTTAGTGSEVTRNAVLGATDHRVKVSLRSPRLLPRVALVDPGLTLELPPALTATTGLDALTQLVEPFLSCRSNPLTDGLCREGIRRAARALPRAFVDGSDVAAREDMACASLLSGLALANAGLGAVHGFAGPIGGMYPIAHGAICAALLAPTLSMNLRALRERAPDAPALAKFDELGVLLTGDPKAGADAAVGAIQRLCSTLKILRLAELGLPPAEHGAVVAKALQASSMKANPVDLTPGELHTILDTATY